MRELNQNKPETILKILHFVIINYNLVNIEKKMN